MTFTRDQKVMGLFRVLMAGHRVKIGDRTFLICETCDHGADDYTGIDLATLAHDQNGKEHYLRTHATLGAFVRIAESMTDDEWVIAAANKALTELRSERWDSGVRKPNAPMFY